MQREPLIELLAAYDRRYPDLSVSRDFIQFVETNNRCFERSLTIGHFTRSAWIVDPAQQKVLLVHHKKLGLWLQPGGHCDGDADVVRVAEKEVHEEIGLTLFTIFSDAIFDLDIHRIPPWKEVPEHLHYDVRFLIHADSQQAIQLSEESNALRWFKLGELCTAIQDPSVLQLGEKSLVAP